MEQLSNHATKLLPYGTTPFKVVGKYSAPTLKLFAALHRAAQYFQDRLFLLPLSPYIFSLNKTAKSKGYYKPFGWNENQGAILPEINIHPSLLLIEPIELMATVVHELAHHYHQQYGKPGNYGYHNKEFAEIMKSLGLQCSHTGKPGGKDIGKNMSHFIIPGGKFENMFNEMPKECLVPFKPIEQDLNIVVDLKKVAKEKERAKRKVKTKYTCLGCSLVMWGRPNAFVICGECDERLVIIDDFGKKKDT
ncbi:MAG: hypothetical protein HEQ40_12245 [Lacibacter sp.]|jgi:predicted SprT family Zn-dependent metalloprotease